MFCWGLWQGLLLGIDAEFVALSASEKGSREDGVEFVKRPARLSLARVSVVRGEGDKAGVCCIDDYICMVEPVYDYLTRYSGVSPGDLVSNPITCSGCFDFMIHLLHVDS
jgi:PAB-dependent poly(A)-specific ribonuclease subunit 2